MTNTIVGKAWNLISEIDKRPDRESYIVGFASESPDHFKAIVKIAIHYEFLGNPAHAAHLMPLLMRLSSLEMRNPDLCFEQSVPSTLCPTLFTYSKSESEKESKLRESRIQFSRQLMEGLFEERGSEIMHCLLASTNDPEKNGQAQELFDHFMKRRIPCSGPCALKRLTTTAVASLEGGNRKNAVRLLEKLINENENGLLVLLNQLFCTLKNKPATSQAAIDALYLIDKMKGKELGEADAATMNNLGHKLRYAAFRPEISEYTLYFAEKIAEEGMNGVGYFADSLLILASKRTSNPEEVAHSARKALGKLMGKPLGQLDDENRRRLISAVSQANSDLSLKRFAIGFQRKMREEGIVGGSETPPPPFSRRDRNVGQQHIGGTTHRKTA